MSFPAVIFQSIPESVIILYLGLASIGVRAPFRKVFPAAVLSAAISWLVRGLPLPFGIHTVIGVMIITGIYCTLFRIHLIKSVTASLFAIGCLISTEALILPVVQKLTGFTNVKDIWAEPVLRVVLAVPEMVFLGLIAYLMLKYNISFEKLTGENRFPVREKAKR